MVKTLKNSANACRAAAAGALIRACRGKAPAFLKVFAAQVLITTAAKAFRRKTKAIWYLLPERALEEFARFTATCAADVQDTETLRRLYHAALILGQRVRLFSGLTDPDDLRRLAFFLYSAIEIDMHGLLPGEITVKACYFADYYTPEVCAVMAHMDAGLIEGIVGKGSLLFTERLTEGCGSCRACFRARRKVWAKPS